MKAYLFAEKGPSRFDEYFLRALRLSEILSQTAKQHCIRIGVENAHGAISRMFKVNDVVANKKLLDPCQHNCGVEPLTPDTEDDGRHGVIMFGKQ